MATPTKLGQRVNGAPVQSTTKLASRIVGGRRGELRTVPWFGLVRVEILGVVESQEVEAAVYAEMRRLDLPLNHVTAERFELERARRTLASSFRDPDDRTLAYGSLEEWGALDSDVVIPAWHEYGDVRDRLNPIATALEEDERILIEAAIKKKQEELLRSFGTVKLSRFLVSMESQRSTSPPPSSQSGESAPE